MVIGNVVMVMLSSRCCYSDAVMSILSHGDVVEVK